ncbi:MAG TPA: hypothetical protein VE669_07410 [Actinomycetota bacterium]|nr:hypothetical protein [Actinomycetota bacterium]
MARVEYAGLDGCLGCFEVELSGGTPMRRIFQHPDGGRSIEALLVNVSPDGTDGGLAIYREDPSG